MKLPAELIEAFRVSLTSYVDEARRRLLTQRAATRTWHCKKVLRVHWLKVLGCKHRPGAHSPRSQPLAGR
jgi:hypothetical protein